MNRDIYCGNFVELQELQPASHTFNPFNLAQASTNAYEMTGASAGASGVAVEREAVAPQPLPHEHRSEHHDARKRSASHFGAPNHYEDGDERRSTRSDKKQNHSEIEKRRRDTMNTYISELSAMVPMCGAMARKLDKLTVLRMAVQHLRSVRGALAAGALAAGPRPALLTERELNALVLHAARDAFVLVVGCDRGRLLYASDSTADVLRYERTDLLGQSLFDLLHPKDVAKVKEQLSSSDLGPRERLIDAKTMLPVKAEPGAGASRLCPGARRSFFCRIKWGASPRRGPVKEEPESSARPPSHERNYCVVQLTGYLKSWAPADAGEGGAGVEAEDGDAGGPSCLVATGRTLADLTPPPPARPAPPSRPLQYMSRHAVDGKYLFVDQRVTPALGYLPQELLGTSLYEYVSGSDLATVARAHKMALLHQDALHTPPYSFRRKDGSVALLQTHFKPFRNPWSKDMECLVAQNTLLPESAAATSSRGRGAGAGGGAQRGEPAGDGEVQRLIDSLVESHKIGSAIAEEALRGMGSGSPELPPELLEAFEPQPATDAACDEDRHVRNDVTLGSAGGRSPSDAGDYPPAAMSLDGNGEAAIAVIMNLLEADAGLGGPVNFSGLPWPLP